MGRKTSQFAVGLLAVFGAFGCGGGGSNNNSTPTFPLAGNYVGSGLSTHGTIVAEWVTIANSGAMTLNYTDSDTNASGQILGTVAGNGVVTFAGTPPPADSLTFAKSGSGQLTGFLTSQPPSSTGTYVTISPTSSPIQFVGSYSGSITKGSVTGTATLTIASTGAVTGSATMSTGNLTLSGTIGPSGLMELVEQPATGSNIKNEGGVAFNQSGQLAVQVIDISGTADITTLTLTPSTNGSGIRR